MSVPYNFSQAKIAVDSIIRTDIQDVYPEMELQSLPGSSSTNVVLAKTFHQIFGRKLLGLRGSRICTLEHPILCYNSYTNKNFFGVVDWDGRQKEQSMASHPLDPPGYPVERLTLQDPGIYVVTDFGRISSTDFEVIPTLKGGLMSHLVTSGGGYCCNGVWLISNAYFCEANWAEVLG